MISSKQRSYLRKLANDIQPVVHVGKNGITDNLIEQVSELLELRELIKGTVLKNSIFDAKEVVHALAEELNAEAVQAIGRKFVLYRESVENKEIKLPK